MPILRATPEDFFVEEIPLFEASGVGEHTYVKIEKRGRTTEEVAQALARLAGVRAGDVGYAGRKDRHAVTRQWFSVPKLAAEVAQTLTLDGVTVLEAKLHAHKLRVGQLAGNRFVIVVRDISEALGRDAEAQAVRLALQGMPNRFGEQRFGRFGDNAARGRALLKGDRDVHVGKHQRRDARFLISALQSEVFNQVLVRRPWPLDRLQTGDIAIKHASGGVFTVEDAQAEQSRADAFEISPTGPIFGTRRFDTMGEVEELEKVVMQEMGIPPAAEWKLPRGLQLKGSRRALRVRPEEVSVNWSSSEQALHLAFALPAGSYATVFIEELLGEECNALRE